MIERINIPIANCKVNLFTIGLLRGDALYVSGQCKAQPVGGSALDHVDVVLRLYDGQADQPTVDNLKVVKGDRWHRSVLAGPAPYRGMRTNNHLLRPTMKKGTVEPLSSSTEGVCFNCAFN
jgi:hypothetical protein